MRREIKRCVVLFENGTNISFRGWKDEEGLEVIKRNPKFKDFGGIVDSLNCSIYDTVTYPVHGYYQNRKLIMTLEDDEDMLEHADKRTVLLFDNGQNVVFKGWLSKSQARRKTIYKAFDGFGGVKDMLTCKLNDHVTFPIHGYYSKGKLNKVGELYETKEEKAEKEETDVIIKNKVLPQDDNHTLSEREKFNLSLDGVAGYYNRLIKHDGDIDIDGLNILNMLEGYAAHFSTREGKK